MVNRKAMMIKPMRRRVVVCPRPQDTPTQKDLKGFQVRLEAELLNQRPAELLQILRTQVESPVTYLTNHVVVTGVRVGQLIVQPVSYGDLGHHIQLLK